MLRVFTLALAFISFPSVAIQEGDDCTQNMKLGSDFLCRDGLALDCRNADGKNDLALCSNKKFKKADYELNAVYQNVLKSLDKPRDDNSNYKKARQRLIEAQRLWVKFRDTECSIGWSLNLYGSLQAAESEECRTQLTKKRAKEIQGWYMK